MRIGEVAALVGVSTRAVRHYHRIGLLPEPARRANGYREYALRDAVALARVRRLVELGLSLEEVGEALARDADRDLVEVLRELDGDLARQEREIRGRRERLAQLLAGGGGVGDQAPVSAELAALFDRMAQHPESAMAAKERALMALLETAEAGGDGWLAVLTRSLGAGPEAMARAYAVYAQLDELADAPADDPRVEVTAQAIVAAIPEAVRRTIRVSAAGGASAAGAAGAAGAASAAGAEKSAGAAGVDEAQGGFAAAFYEDHTPAQAAAIRRAIALLIEEGDNT